MPCLWPWSCVVSWCHCWCCSFYGNLISNENSSHSCVHQPHFSPVCCCQAVGYGLLTLNESQYKVLQEGEMDPTAPMVCIGAGTGLGEVHMRLLPTTTTARHCNRQFSAIMSPLLGVIHRHALFFPILLQFPTSYSLFLSFTLS